MHQGIPITCPQRHNYKKFMEVVGPEGLEHSDVGYAIPAPVTVSSRPLALRQWPAGTDRVGKTEEV